MKTDSPHILCVNPWIHDFAAFDFWAKPLGLLFLAAILRENGLKISYIDCLDRFHPLESHPVKVQQDGRGPFRKTRLKAPYGLDRTNLSFSRYGILPQWFEADLREIGQPDLVLVTSMMTYWASGVRETIAAIKRIYPDVPVILGGIYATLCYDHALKTSGADRVIQGPGEIVLPALIREFTGFDITGFNINDERLGRNQETGTKKQDNENSYILNPDLDSFPFPALDIQRRLSYVPLLTSRGCPFSCEYCASSFLEPIIRRRSPDSMFTEIQYWHEKFNIRNFAFYDDALLINADKYALPLFEKILSSYLDVCFHTPNAIHIRSITSVLTEMMFKTGFKTIRLGLETAEFSGKRHYDGKVAEQEFLAAVRHLKTAGFERKQLGAYLLCGLPGQDIDQVEAAMHFVANAGIMPVLAYYTPIPHTPLWEKAVSNSRYDLLADPIFSNNTLFPCVKSEADIRRIARLKNRFR